MNKNKIEILFFSILVTSIIYYVFYLFQSPVTYPQCKLCDGNQYLRIYDFFKGNTRTYDVGFPYYSRVIVPLLASMVPVSNPIQAFNIVNYVFVIFSVLSILYLWQYLEIPKQLAYIGLFLLLFHWTGIIRLNIFDPVTVDVPTYLIQTLFILIFLTRRFQWLLLLGPLAVLQRESIIVLLLVLFIFSFAGNTFTEERRYPLVIILISLLLTILSKYLFTLGFPSADPDKSSVRLVLFYIKEVLVDPLKAVRWLVSIGMAFGPLLLVAIQNISKRLFFNNFLIFLTVMSGVYILLAIIAGGDSTRIVFLGFPFIMTWILLLIKDKDYRLIAVAVTLSILQMRLFTSIPDPGKSFSKFAQWYPEFADIGGVAGWGIYFIFCYLILLGLDKKLKSNRA